MKKVLIIASVASMIDQFNMQNISILQNMGYEVHVAANFEVGNTSSTQRVFEFVKELEVLSVKYFHVNFSRNIWDLKSNYKAYKQIKNLIKKYNYHFIHCHSPIGGVCGRFAAYFTDTKVIYTAHGFHFYHGASIMNWILYYPIEKLLARITDILITINKEDYEIAKRFKSGKILYVPGVGINTTKYQEITITSEKKRKELCISENSYVILSVGELSKRKNHEVVIDAIAKLQDPTIVYIICGQGCLERYLRDKAKNLNVNVMFLGYRKDVNEIYKVADIFVFPSLQEGLPVALMEAMAAGLPVVCSKIRGNCDLIEDIKGGYLINPNDSDNITHCILELKVNNDVCDNFRYYNQNFIKNFDNTNINELMINAYRLLD